MSSAADQRSQVSGDSDPDGFVALLLANQRRIYSFLGALLPHRADLDDVYQQTCLRLWEKRSLYDPAKPFLPWAFTFARHEAFNHARRFGKGRLLFSEGFLAHLADAREAGESLAEARRAALNVCLEQLLPHQRELLQQRYEGVRSVKEMAADMKVSAASLTMRLQRIRHAVLKCVENALGHDAGGQAAEARR